MTSLPLAGKRVLITRARGQSGRLQAKLEAAGAEVIAIPAIEIVPPDSFASLDAALRDLVAYDWLVLTSANAARAMAERMKALAIPIEALVCIYIAAIGKATADAVTELGATVELIPSRAVAESLAEALAPRVAGKHVLLVRAKLARDVLPEALIAAGAKVTIAEAYQTIVPSGSMEALREALGDASQAIDAVLFTSGSSVHNFAGLAEAARVVVDSRMKKISIGPITTLALRENGWDADGEAASADIDALVAACVRAVSLQGLRYQE